MSDLREKIRHADDIRSEDVDVPEWDCKIRIQTMSGDDRMSLMARVAKDPAMIEAFGENGEMDPNANIPFGALMTYMVIACSRDPETGQKVFTWDDLAWLNEKSGRALERLGIPAMRMSGMNEEAVAEAMGNSLSPAPNEGTS